MKILRKWNLWMLWWRYLSSRNFLIIQSLITLTLIILIHLELRPPFFEPADGTEENLEINFQKSFLDAAEALEYMYNSQNGRARIEPIVEDCDIPVIEMRRCSGKDPKSEGQIEADKKWTKNGNFYIFSAYLDYRQNSLFPDIPAVQILASVFGTAPLNAAHYCHFRHFHAPGDPHEWDGVVMRAHIRRIWQRAWDPRNEFYNAFLITCPAAKRTNLNNSFVLISTNQFCINSDPEDKANFTKVLNNIIKDSVIERGSVLRLQSDQIKIAVCVKGLAFLNESEFSARKAIEWVLLQKEFGADLITVYIYWVPDSVRRALQTMADQGYLEIIDLDLPGNSPNHPFVRHQFIMRNKQQKRRHELIPYNDCFYRHSSTHHFVLIVDIDELVIPRRHANWQQLLGHVLGHGNWRAEPSSISIRNVFKFWDRNSSDNDGHSLLTHRWRSETVQQRDQYGKSFVNTQSVASVFNHFALHRLHANVSRTVHVDEEEAVKLHWKRECPEAELGQERCRELRTKLVQDNLLDRIRNRIDRRVARILEELQKK